MKWIPRDTRRISGRVLPNFLIMLFWQAGNYVLPLLTYPYLARVLGLEQFGALGFSLAIITYATVLTDWGFNLSASRKIALSREFPDLINEIFWNTVLAKIALAIVSLLLLTVAIIMSPRLMLMRDVLYAGWLLVLGNVLTTTWLAQGLERMGGIATAALLGRTAILPLTFILVQAPGDTWVAALIQGLGSIVGGGCSLWIVVRLRIVGKPHASISGIFRQIADSWQMFLSVLSTVLFNASNSVILGVLVGNHAVALYSGADKIKTAANTAVAQINHVLYPRINSLYDTKKQDAIRLIRMGIMASLILSSLTLLFIMFFGDQIIRFFLGVESDTGAAVLKILSLSTLIGNIAYAIGINILVPEGATNARTKIMLLFGIVNVPVAICLASLFGVIGAAYSLLLCEFMILIGYVFELGKRKLLGIYLSGCK